MRIEQLEAVAAVIRTGSMRRASEELHVSQPALSQTIGNLERELGVTLLDRHRNGTRISPAGQELLPRITDVLDAVHHLRVAVDAHVSSRPVLRVGTVHAATVPLVTPAIRAFRASRPDTQVELINFQFAEIHQALLGGRLDLGLVNLLDGDDVPPELDATLLLRGNAVVCCRADSPLATLSSVTVDELFAQPFVAMRSGYLMHRYAHRLLGSAATSSSVFAFSADGAEMGKTMVAAGLGVTLLPDFSVAGDPLERAGVITYRPLRSDDSEVLLVALRRRTRHQPVAVRALERLLLAQAVRFRETFDPRPARPATG